MDFVEAARIKAMLDVMEGDFLYHYRRICRWYSQKFHTPLPTVEELPEEQVLQTFFETQFEDMTKAERRKLALEMTETPEEKVKREQQAEEHSDDAFLKKMEKEAKKEERKAAKKLADSAKAAAKKIAELAGKEMAAPVEAKPPPSPEISMQFDDNGNLLDEESIPLPPRKKR